MRFYNPSVLEHAINPSLFGVYSTLFFFFLVFSLGLSGHWLVCQCAWYV